MTLGKAKIFLDATPKTDKLDFIKIKFSLFCTSKNTTEWIKRHTVDLGEVFANHITLYLLE